MRLGYVSVTAIKIGALVQVQREEVLKNSTNVLTRFPASLV